MPKKKSVDEEVDSSGVLEFDITRTVIPIKIKTKNGIDEYELKEATGDAACRWRNSILSKTKLGPEGKPQTIVDLADSEPVLVALCLYPKGSDKNINTALVRSWPARVQKALFAKAKEISDVDEDDEDKESAKNEQGSTQAG